MRSAISALFLAALFWSNFSPALDFPSQARAPNESYQDAVVRYVRELAKRGIELAPDFESAMGAAVSPDQLDFSDAPEWTDPKAGFEAGRDTRFLKMPGQPGFLRRPSWLYPDDGCYARAAVAGQELKRLGFPRPRKLFIFGSLYFKTRYSPSGGVSWWYHVVPAFQSDHQLYVVDPAIEPREPLRMDAWILRMTKNPKSVRVSLCSPYTYEPGNSCYESVPGTEAGAVGHQGYFLQLEWSRLRDLGRDPVKELGDEPPWNALSLPPEAWAASSPDIFPRWP